MTLQREYDYTYIYDEMAKVSDAYKRKQAIALYLATDKLGPMSDRYFKLTFIRETRCISITTRAGHECGYISQFGVLVIFNKLFANIKHALELEIPILRDCEIRNYAALFAQRTERCCFCNAPIKNTLSLYNGYGRDCAKIWQLPFNEPPKPQLELWA